MARASKKLCSFQDNLIKPHSFLSRFCKAYQKKVYLCTPNDLNLKPRFVIVNFLYYIFHVYFY